MPIAEPKIAGSPVGRRVVLGLVSAGVAGIVGGGAVQKGLASVLGPIGNHDPTGLIGLIPVGDNFRFYSVTQGAPRHQRQNGARRPQRWHPPREQMRARIPGRVAQGRRAMCTSWRLSSRKWSRRKPR